MNFTSIAFDAVALYYYFLFFFSLHIFASLMFLILSIVGYRRPVHWAMWLLRCCCYYV